MILSFSRLTPWGTPTEFKEQIQTGGKIHTMREIPRWKPGIAVDFWQENPRNTHKNPEVFFIDKERAASWKKVERNSKIIHLPVCCATEQVEMTFFSDEKVQIKIGSFFIDDENLFNLFARQDGFPEPYDMIRWFWIGLGQKPNTTITRQLVHWTKHGIYDVKNAVKL